MTIQNSYSINSEPAPPRSIPVTIHLNGVDRSKAEELKDKLTEAAERLANELLNDGQYRIEGKVV